MTERNLGNDLTWWVGKVVNVNDPDQSGRVQIRVFGRHDDKNNIKDSDLHWALPIQPVTSAAFGKIGTSPLGLVKGSKVMGFWLDKDQQYPAIWGSFGKAGNRVEGLSENGTEKIDTSTGSMPAAAQNHSDPLPYTPYNAMGDFNYNINTVNNSDDQTEKELDNLKHTDGVDNKEVVDKKLKEPTKPTTASAAKDDNSDVVDIVKSVDPNKASRALPNAIDSFGNVRNIMSLTSPRGITNMLQGGIMGAIGGLGGKLGFKNVIGPLIGLLRLNILPKEAQSALRMALAISTSSYQKNGYYRVNTVSSYVPAVNPMRLPPQNRVITIIQDTYVQQYYGMNQEPYPGYIEFLDPDTKVRYYYLRGREPYYPSAQAHIRGNAQATLQAGLAASLAAQIANNSGLFSTYIDPRLASDMAKVFTGALGGVRSQGLSKVLGHGINLSNIMKIAKILIPGIAKGINSLLSGHLPKSVLDEGKVGETMNNYTANQSKLALKKKSMKEALEPASQQEQDNQINAFANNEPSPWVYTFGA